MAEGIETAESATGEAAAAALVGDERQKRRMVGVVSSSKMQKTVKVEVRSTTVHGRFQKYLSRRKAYLVHDEKGECREGDKVVIVETRPTSKRKSFRIQEILERAKV
ncbi:MAG: 30S ribosomal protein S17 [Deltaproteobacteria bacterium]|nr:30S ribosomal protein S17 [Deltaproteobacteria bacterium]